MVKKQQNPLHIDFEKCIVEHRLLQIRNVEDGLNLKLASVWTVDINPRDSKIFINFIKQTTELKDPIDLTHLKRIQKIKRDSSDTILRVLLCSTAFISQLNELKNLLLSMQITPSQYSNLCCVQQIPLQTPPTKKIMSEWSQKYWPMVWCGNPNDQILNDCIFDMGTIRAKLSTISEQSLLQRQKGNSCCTAALFVNPLDGDETLAFDTRVETDSNVLNHCIMNGIRKVASKEQIRREKVASGLIPDKDQVYLCLNFDVYITHEPCSMCAMALIHSRIKRCIFIKPMATTGSLKKNSGDGYTMHNRKLLNSSYEVFQWIGDEYPVGDISSDTCC